jgi:hypothetical protein
MGGIGNYFLKIDNCFLDFETGFSVQKKYHGMLFEIKNVSRIRKMLKKIKLLNLSLQKTSNLIHKISVSIEFD